MQALPGMEGLIPRSESCDRGIRRANGFLTQYLSRVGGQLVGFYGFGTKSEALRNLNIREKHQL